jgi:hypothetical protein
MARSASWMETRGKPIASAAPLLVLDHVERGGLAAVNELLDRYSAGQAHLPAMLRYLELSPTRRLMALSLYVLGVVTHSRYVRE